MAMKREKLRYEAVISLLVNMLINMSIFQSDYEGGLTRLGNDGHHDSQNRQVIKTIVPKQYDEDVGALCTYAGVAELTPGLTIRMTLQEILTVVPKSRRRLDSYSSLVKFLQDEMAVTLILTSNKTKSNGNN